MPYEKKHSAAWDGFYESFFGDPYMAWHDGLDTESLGALQGEEPIRPSGLAYAVLQHGLE